MIIIKQCKKCNQRIPIHVWNTDWYKINNGNIKNYDYVKQSFPYLSDEYIYLITEDLCKDCKKIEI